MKNLVRISKLFIIGACFLGMQASQAMMQNILDYIQAKGKPVAQKTVDSLLLTPRTVYQAMMVNSYPDTIGYGLQRDTSRTPEIIKVWKQLYLLGAPLFAMATPIGSLWINSPISDSLFMRAIEENNLGLMQSLIAAGYDVNRNNGHALRNAAINNPAAVELLLKAGANVNAMGIESRTRRTTTALINAVDWSNLANVKLLLAADADPLKKDDRGQNALLYAEIHAGINSWDDAETQQNKREIQRLLRFHMAKQELKPQVEHLLERKKAADLAQEAMEKYYKKAGSQAGAKDVAGVIKGYL